MITEGWVFQHREGYQMNISKTDKGFQQGLRRIQLEELGLIPEVVEVAEEMILGIIEKRIDHRSIE